jgi:anti-sigma-K factor RskA
MTHDDYRELLAAHALTALDAENTRALNTHLESCADCRSEMNDWQDAVALLALDLKPVEPSPNVRERILASARAEGDAGRPANDRAVAIASSSESPGESKVLAFELERPPRNIWTSLGALGAMAATLAFVALIISLIVLWQQNRATQKELARLSTETRQARAQLDHERVVVELLTSPDAHMAKLSGTNAAPGAHAMLAYDKNGHAMLLAKGLPAAPKGMAYQLWYIKDNKKMPGKMFVPDAAGNGILEDQIPPVARDQAVFAITLEPESGVQVPTGSIYLLSAS